MMEQKHNSYNKKQHQKKENNSRLSIINQKGEVSSSQFDINQNNLQNNHLNQNENHTINQTNQSSVQERQRNQLQNVQEYIRKNTELIQKVEKLQEIVIKINRNSNNNNFIQNQNRNENSQKMLQIDSQKVRKWIQKKQRQEKIKQQNQNINIFNRVKQQQRQDYQHNQMYNQKQKNQQSRIKKNSLANTTSNTLNNNQNNKNKLITQNKIQKTQYHQQIKKKINPSLNNKKIDKKNDEEKQNLLEEVQQLRMRVEALQSQNKSLASKDNLNLNLILNNHKNSAQYASQKQRERHNKNSFSLAGNSDGPRFGKIVKTGQKHIKHQSRDQFFDQQNSQSQSVGQNQQQLNINLNNQQSQILKKQLIDQKAISISQIPHKNDQQRNDDLDLQSLGQLNQKSLTRQKQNQKLKQSLNQQNEHHQSQMPRGMFRISNAKSNKNLSYKNNLMNNPNAQDVFIRSSNKKLSNKEDGMTNLQEAMSLKFNPNLHQLASRDTIFQKNGNNTNSFKNNKISSSHSRKNIRIKTPSKQRKINNIGLVSQPVQKLIDSGKINALQFNPQNEKILVFDSKQELKLSEQNFYQVEVFNFKQNPMEMIPPNLPLPPVPNESQDGLVQIANKTFEIFNKKVTKQSNLVIKKYNNCILFSLDLDSNILWHFDNGKFYYGGWKISATGQNDKAGQGIQYIPQKYLYIGLFKDGKKNGFGSIKAYGNHRYVYTGQWIDNLKSGLGKQIELTSGAIYQGQWKQGKKNGNGKLIISQCEVHQGFYQNGYKNGFGKQSFKNGDFYEGHYKDGKFQGKGIYNWANGSCYQGSFKSGMRSGYGIWQSSSQYPFDQYQGQYLNDKKHGRGTYRWPNGAVYDGNFQNDLKHGQGYVRYQNGKQVKILWKKGQAIQKLQFEGQPSTFRQFQRSGGNTNGNKMRNSQQHHYQLQNPFDFAQGAQINQQHHHQQQFINSYSSINNLKNSNEKTNIQDLINKKSSQEKLNSELNNINTNHHQLLQRPKQFININNRISTAYKNQNHHKNQNINQNYNLHNQNKMKNKNKTKSQPHFKNTHPSPPKFFQRHSINQVNHKNYNINPEYSSSSSSNFNIHFNHKSKKNLNKNIKQPHQTFFKSKQFIPNLMFESRARQTNYYNNNQIKSNNIPFDRPSKGMRKTENFLNF